MDILSGRDGEAPLDASVAPLVVAAGTGDLGGDLDGIPGDLVGVEFRDVLAEAGADSTGDGVGIGIGDAREVAAYGGKGGTGEFLLTGAGAAS